MQLAARAAADAIAAPVCDRMRMLEHHVDVRLGAVESRLSDVQLAVFTMSESFAVLSQQLQMLQSTYWCPMIPVCQPQVPPNAAKGEANQCEHFRLDSADRELPDCGVDMKSERSWVDAFCDDLLTDSACSCAAMSGEHMPSDAGTLAGDGTCPVIDRRRCTE